MKIFRVEAEYIKITFPLIQNLLQKALDRGLGEITLDQVKDYCKTGQQQLWIGLDEDTKDIPLAFTTEVITYATGQKHLAMHLVGSKKHTIKKWIDHWVEPVEDFCRDNNVKYIQTFSRDGWLRVIKHLGYKKYYTSQIKEIKYD
tara:strand:+ start:69 stop:503 length:435 start_codon:yes stop_codon:yes gene_type:complete